MNKNFNNFGIIGNKIVKRIKNTINKSINSKNIIKKEPIKKSIPVKKEKPKIQKPIKKEEIKIKEELAELQDDALIISKPTASKETILKWAENLNTNDLFKSWLPIAWEVGLEYGIDPVFIIAQFTLETGYAKFGGVLDASYHNVCGLKNPKGGSDVDANAHMKFSSWEEGITAQVQHLALYADAPKLKGKKIVDPRHFEWIRGTAKTASELSSKWATGPSYGEKINKLCKQIAK